MSSQSCTGKARFAWWQWLGWLAAIGALALSLGGWSVYSRTATALRQAQTDVSSLWQLWRDSQEMAVVAHEGWTYVLALGSDELDNREHSYPMTDTIIIVAINTQAGVVNLLSLPRDLYSDGTRSRINSWYAAAGGGQDTDTARARVSEQISELTGVPIDYTLVLTLAQVRRFIDLLGGVDVEVHTAFADEQFPREDVDTTSVFDPAALYETVSFEAGWQHFDGATALKFMRSRHAQSAEGSDFARSARQQQVISSIGTRVSEQLQTSLKAFDVSLLGRLYNFYSQELASQISMSVWLSMLQKIVQNDTKIAINRQNLDVGPQTNITENARDFTLHIRSLPQFRADVAAKLTKTD